MKKQTLGERLLDKLKKLGLPERKAREVAKGLAPTAARQTVSGTVTGKLEAKLLKLGLSERKAKELAKGLAPLVRSAIKTKVKVQAKTLDDVTDKDVNDTVDDTVDEVDDAELDQVAPRVNGHRVRLDLPVVSRATWQNAPVHGIELLRVMDGLTTTATYLVAAVKGDVGIVAVRQLSQSEYRVKFYPAMGFWNKSVSGLTDDFGAQDFVEREWYQRMHFSREGLTKLLVKLAKETKPKGKTALLRRFLSVSGGVMVKAFTYLHKRVHQAA